MMSRQEEMMELREERTYTYMPSLTECGKIKKYSLYLPPQSLQSLCSDSSLLPAPSEAITVMVYLLSSSKSGIVWLVAVIVVLPVASSEQPTEVSVVHSIRYSVTTEPLEILQEMEMVVAVVESVPADG